MKLSDKQKTVMVWTGWILLGIFILINGCHVEIHIRGIQENLEKTTPVPEKERKEEKAPAADRWAPDFV